MTQQNLFPDQEEEKESLPVAIPAKVSHKPEKGLDGKILGQSGRLYLELFNKKDPMYAFSKTLLATFPLALMKFSMIWKVKATTQGRLYAELKRQAHHTNAIDSGSSQEMWPTPNAWDGNRGARSKENLLTKKHQINLITAVKDAADPNPVHIWPTPRASLGMTMKLTKNMAKLRHKKYPETEMAYQIHKDHQTDNQKKESKQLNSDWVEWLMGYPLGWTSL